MSVCAEAPLQPLALTPRVMRLWWEAGHGHMRESRCPGLPAVSELHSGLQVSPFATQASPVISVACILGAEHLVFRTTLAVHRLPCSERRYASAASGKDPGRVWEEEML